MALSGYVLGYADFSLALPSLDAASLLSQTIFGGILFVEIEDHESGQMLLRLESDFMGFTADLVGAEEHYTLELGTLPSASAADGTAVCDLSALLKRRLSRVPGVELLPPKY